LKSPIIICFFNETIFAVVFWYVISAPHRTRPTMTTKLVYSILLMFVMYVTSSMADGRIGKWSKRALQQAESRKRHMEVTRDVLGRQEIRIAVIAPVSKILLFSLTHVVPSILFAIESPRVRELLPKCYITLLTADSNCDAVSAPIQAFDFYWRKKVYIKL